MASASMLTEYDICRTEMLHTTDFSQQAISWNEHNVRLNNEVKQIGNLFYFAYQAIIRFVILFIYS